MQKTYSCSWSLSYSAILRSQADSLRSHMILHEWLAFYSAFLNIHRSGVPTVLAWLVPHETAAVSAQSLCTPYNHAPCHFMQSYICKVHAYLAVTCHLHFWQNDQGLLHATRVTRGWNIYRNKNQHRKLTVEKKMFLLLLQGFKAMTFRSWVRHSNHWAIPAPQCQCHYHHSVVAMLTLRLILMIPVRTETLENSTALKISIFSENSFWILLIRLLSTLSSKKHRLMKCFTNKPIDTLCNSQLPAIHIKVIFIYSILICECVRGCVYVCVCVHACTMFPCMPTSLCASSGEEFLLTGACFKRAPQ